MDSLKSHIEAGIEAARQAGAVLRAGAGDSRQINFESAHDVKLQADVDSEKLIRQLLQTTELPVIGEEEGGEATLVNEEGLYWVVDPLDGTYNYLRNIPMTAVSIGLMRGAAPVWGVIYDFNRDSLYTGGEHVPLEINGIAVRPKWATSISDAVLCCGFPAGGSFAKGNLEQMIAEIQGYKKIRMIGSAALALAYVASGQADAYREDTIWLWDVAAGLALVKAAGGHISMTPVDGKQLRYDVRASGLET